MKVAQIVVARVEQVEIEEVRETDLKKLQEIKSDKKNYDCQYSYVYLDEDFIENKIKLVLSVVKGGCRAITLKEILERHRDIVELDSAQLEQLSYYMLDQVKNSQCDTKDNNDLKKIISRMIAESKVDPNRINDSLKVELGIS